jgi:hypothetical protein
MLSKNSRLCFLHCVHNQFIGNLQVLRYGTNFHDCAMAMHLATYSGMVQTLMTVLWRCKFLKHLTLDQNALLATEFLGTFLSM